MGRCVIIARLKKLALIRAGFPESAFSERTVRAPQGWSQPYHMLLDVRVLVNGRPWHVALDMNDPWPLTPRDEIEFGYRGAPEMNRY